MLMDFTVGSPVECLRDSVAIEDFESEFKIGVKRNLEAANRSLSESTSISIE